MWTSLRLACLGAVLLAFTPWAHAQEEMAGTGDYLQSSQAFKDYMLQCAGCHRYDGQGLVLWLPSGAAMQETHQALREFVGMLYYTISKQLGS